MKKTKEKKERNLSIHQALGVKKNKEEKEKIHDISLSADGEYLGVVSDTNIVVYNCIHHKKTKNKKIKNKWRRDSYTFSTSVVTAVAISANYLITGYVDLVGKENGWLNIHLRVEDTYTRKTPDQTLPPEKKDPLFGRALSVSADGTSLIVGGTEIVYVCTLSNSSITVASVVENRATTNFGVEVSMSPSGLKLAISDGKVVYIYQRTSVDDQFVDTGITMNGTATAINDVGDIAISVKTEYSEAVIIYAYMAEETRYIVKKKHEPINWGSSNNPCGFGRRIAMSNRDIAILASDRRICETSL